MSSPVVVGDDRSKLFQTKLQKAILLIGGFLIFIILLNVGYYDRYNAVFRTIGLLVLIIALLIILQDYHPKFHLKIKHIIKSKKFFIILGIVSGLIIIGLLGFYYANNKSSGAVIIPSQGLKSNNLKMPSMKMPSMKIPMPSLKMEDLMKQ